LSGIRRPAEAQRDPRGDPGLRRRPARRPPRPSEPAGPRRRRPAVGGAVRGRVPGGGGRGGRRRSRAADAQPDAL